MVGRRLSMVVRIEEWTVVAGAGGSKPGSHMITVRSEMHMQRFGPKLHLFSRDSGKAAVRGPPKLPEGQ